MINYLWSVLMIIMQKLALMNKLKNPFNYLNNNDEEVLI